jgi:hypothetical protein
MERIIDAAAHIRAYKWPSFSKKSKNTFEKLLGAAEKSVISGVLAHYFP